SSIAEVSGNAALTRSRLAAAIGHGLSVSLNALLDRGIAPSADPVATTSKVVIEQASAHINQTSVERFRVAQDMLEARLAADPDNVDLQAALSAHLIRGVQMSWYGAGADAVRE